MKDSTAAIRFPVIKLRASVSGPTPMAAVRRLKLGIDGSDCVANVRVAGDGTLYFGMICASDDCKK
jgi:hypothetical protein